MIGHRTDGFAGQQENYLSLQALMWQNRHIYIYVCVNPDEIKTNGLLKDRPQKKNGKN